MKKQLVFTSIALSLMMLSSEGVGQDTSSYFSDKELEGHKGQYLVIKKNVNVRAEPSNKGKRLSKLQRRDVVEILGRVKGTQWFAARKDGLELGFVYGPSLTPMLDASLAEPLKGSINFNIQEKPACDYMIIDEGRFIEEETIFIATDYRARFTCRLTGQEFQFDAFMFMSEIPPDLGRKPIYQITLDLPEIATGYEEFLSATVLYDQADQKVTLDNVTLKSFRAKDLQKERPAQTHKEALLAATYLQLYALNTKAWQTISGQIPNSSGIPPQE